MYKNLSLSAASALSINSFDLINSNSYTVLLMDLDNTFKINNISLVLVDKKGKKVKISYNKRQFYDRILTPMKSMGLIDYDLYKKTYRISDNFNKEMIRIGLLWLREMKKPAKS